MHAQISGEVSGQIAVGNHIMQNNVDHGGIVYVAAPGESPTPRLRPLPVSLTGRRPPEPMGRDREVGAGLDSIAASSCLEFVGPSGMGKTTLLKHLAAVAPADSAPHGVVYHRAHEEPVDDTLQYLFEAFYETVVPFKPTLAQVRHAMHDIEALIALDDLAAGREGVDTLLDSLPSASFVIASDRRRLWGTGSSLALGGLGEEAALALFERELGREIAGDEREAASALVAEVGREPLKVVQLAAQVAEAGGKVAELAGRLGEGGEPVPDALQASLLETLTDEQRQIWEVLALLDGATLPPDHLAAITGVADPQAALDVLVARGLVQAHSPRYSVTSPSPVGPLTRRSPPPSPWDSAVTEHLVGWIGANRQNPDGVVRESKAVLAHLQRLARTGASRDLLRLGRAVEGPLVLGSRWGAWGTVLELEVGAARHLGDRAAEGWALHQRGSRALCLDQPAAARQDLSAALSIRRSLGDAAGAAASQHNLSLLALPPPPPTRPPARTVPPPEPEPEAGPTTRKAWWLALAVLLAAGTAMATLSLVGGDGTGPTNGGQPPAGLEVSPVPVLFGPHQVGVASPARTVVAANKGVEEWALGGLEITGASSGAFLVERESCSRSRLRPGSTCEVSVVFIPSRLGEHEARLVIAGAPAGARSVPLLGSGIVGPGIGDGEAALRWAPPSVDFGLRPVNGAAVGRRLTLHNDGAHEVLLSSVGTTGPAAGDYSIAGSCTTIPSGGTCSLLVAFSPRDAGDRRALLVVATESPARQQPASLSGEGIGGPDGCRLSVAPIGEQRVGAGQRVVVPVRVGDAPAGDDVRVTVSGLEDARVTGTGAGPWTVDGLVPGGPGSRTAVAVEASSGSCSPGTALFNAVVDDSAPPDALTFRWLETVVQAWIEVPPVLTTVLTPLPEDIRRFEVTYTLLDVSTQEARRFPGKPDPSTGSFTKAFAPGELGTGVYLVCASLGPPDGAARADHSEAHAVVVHTDVGSASINALSDLLATLSELSETSSLPLDEGVIC